MKKNLRYYLFIAALMVVASVSAQKNGPKYPTYQPAGRSAGAIMTSTTRSGQSGLYQSTVYSPFSEETPSGPRRIIEDGGEKIGEFPGEYDSSTGKYWDEDSWSWVDTDPTKEGSDLNEIGTPIGAMPWLLLLMMAVGYAYLRFKRDRGTAAHTKAE